MGKVLKRSGWVLLILLLGMLFVLIWYRSASQPQIAGTIHLAGPSAPIDIVRDAEGIPHIYAKSTGDAYFALGFVHAQDRLWQLEMNRRIASGRMAEILGPEAINVDRFLRTIGVRRNAEKTLPNLSPETRTLLEAYAKGINAYLANRTGPLPPEFLLTGAPSPEPWQPVDTLGWQTMMAWDLGANWTQELLRMRLSQRLSLDQINEFLAPYPGDAPVKTQDYTKLYRELSGTTQQLSAIEKIAPPSAVFGVGSNNWVLSGALSETGKPLLANDPHLNLSAPSVWYFAHMSAPGLNVIGATLPGIPAVVLGHNDHVAWGFTNTGPDVQDLFIERVNPDNATQYQTPTGWSGFNTITETIKVKGQPDIKLLVKESRHGPIITGALPLLDKVAIDAKKYVIAFRWAALQPDNLTVQAGIKLNRAKNWQEFLDGAKDFAAPQQNIVYADVDGNIGYIAPGHVPIRKPENDLKGLAPAPGWDARYDWNGYIPFDQLPRQFNPAAQRIVTANQKVVADDYPYFITSKWELPYRFNRINALLDAKPKHSLDSFAAIQKDDVSLAAQELLPILRKTVPRSDRANAALDKFMAWDGTMAIERAEPLIFNAWTRELSRQIFEDELGTTLFEEYWDEGNFHQALVNILKNTDGQGRWCADATKPAGVRAQPCDDVLSNSLEIALDGLEKRFGKNMSTWRWGKAHIARSAHRPFSSVPLLAKLFDIRVPTAGDSFTINVGHYDLRKKDDLFTVFEAPSLRALYDLSDLDNSRFIQSTGQSGNVLSPLYRNFAQRWAHVEYLPMITKRVAVEKNELGTLTLSPK
jgi:penicillin amidase